MQALGKPSVQTQAPTPEERERRLKLTEELTKEHEAHNRLTDVCKFCIYKAAFLLDNGNDVESTFARSYLSKISLPVINAAITDVDFALDMRGMIKPFMAGELAA